ncbi:MAG: site-2 protease family protein [Acidobacteriota bacterium]
MEPTMKIGRLFGIELNLGYSWFLVFFFATLVMAMQFGDHFPYWPSWQQFAWGLATSLLFFTSILGHELAHSLVAHHFGIRVHSIMLYVFGGWARLGRPARIPREEFAIAFVGPLTNLAFASLFAVGWLVSESIHPALVLLTGRLAWINLILAGFNLLPAFPLDGGLVIRSLLWYIDGEYTRATRVTAYIGQVLSVIFILTGFYFFIKAGIAGLWFVFIGYNFFSAANLHLQEANLKDIFKSFKVGDLDLQQLISVGGQTSVQEFLECYCFGNSNNWYLVVDEGNVIGIVTAEQARAEADYQCRFTPISWVMTPLSKLETVNLETGIVQALELMDCNGITKLPVISNRELQGFIGRESLVNFIREHFDCQSRTYAHK